MKLLIAISFAMALCCSRQGHPSRSSEQQRRAESRRANSAEALTEVFAHSRFDAWHIQAFAISEQCSVLYVHVDDMVLDDSMAEAFYYGALGSENSPRYAVTSGGIRQFAVTNGFRGVIFGDRANFRRAFGDAKTTEAENPTICGMATR